MQNSFSQTSECHKKSKRNLYGIPCLSQLEKNPIMLPAVSLPDCLSSHGWPLCVLPRAGVSLQAKCCIMLSKLNRGTSCRAKAYTPTSTPSVSGSPRKRRPAKSLRRCARLARRAPPRPKHSRRPPRRPKSPRGRSNVSDNNHETPVQVLPDAKRVQSGWRMLGST